MTNFYATLCLFLLFCSCSEIPEDGTRTRPGTDKVQVVLPIAESFDQAAAYASEEMPVTRTLILGDGGLDKVGWAETDKVAIWAAPAGGGTDFALTAETFSYYTPLQGNALFTATIHEMTEPTYIYYGAYPVPNSINGTQVSYNLPAQQSGSYDGKLDIMLARPAEGSALTENTSPRAAQLAFAHQCHVMRIQVPTGRNLWGDEIHKLRIEFPAEVVGDLTFDITDPTAAPAFSNGSRTVTLALERPFDESTEDAPDGNYVWLFLRPGVELNGTMKFTAYSAEGYQSETLSAPISKTLVEGRITPITLTIPKELPVTYFDLSIGTNNLGEAPTSFTITTPAGVTLRDGATQQHFEINDTNKYTLSYYNLVDGTDNALLFRTSATSIQFESESAIVSSKHILGAQTSVSLTVPYLFAEDFTDATSYNNSGHTSNNDGAEGNVSWADAAGLPGWSGNQYNIEGGKCASIRHRYENGLLATGTYRGRLDTAPMPLKEGKTVKVSVSFSYSGKTGNSKVTPQLTYGYTTNQDAMRGFYSATKLSEGGFKIDPAVATVKTNTSGSYDSVGQIAPTFYIDNCTNLHRLSWDCGYSGTAVANFNNQWVFIDNIKVQIVK